MFSFLKTWIMIDLVACVEIIIVPLMRYLEAIIHILWVALDDLLTDECMIHKKVIFMIIILIINICTIVIFLRTIIYVLRVAYADILAVFDTVFNQYLEMLTIVATFYDILLATNCTLGDALYSVLIIIDERILNRTREEVIYKILVEN